MEAVYTGHIEKRLTPRFEAIFGVYIRVPVKGGGHEIKSRTSANLSTGGVGVYTEDLGLNIYNEYDMAITTKMKEHTNVYKVHMFKAIPRHTTKGITGFLLIRKTKPTFA